LDEALLETLQRAEPDGFIHGTITLPLLRAAIEIALRKRRLEESLEAEIRARQQTEAVAQARLRLIDPRPAASLDELIQKALDSMEGLTGSNIGFYHFIEADQRTLTLQSWSTHTLETMCHAEGRGQHYDLGRAGVWGDCVRQRRPVIHNDYATLPNRQGLPEGHAVITRMLAVPIFRGEQVVAIIGVGNKLTDYTPKDIQTVAQLGDFSWDIADRMRAQEALAATHARLEREHSQLQAQLDEIQALQALLREQAIRDALTGLFNRRYLQEIFKTELAQADRQRTPIGLVLMDIDHFKGLNDQHGHEAGDLFLQALGQFIRSYSRQMDIACRYGGEEFVILMPGAAVEEAAQRAEDWRAAFAAYHLDYAGASLQVTLSLGVAAYPANGPDVDALLRAADRALYAAKAAGRNCVRVCQAG
jgi:diguanylate cyclase (GGDEF)-like protein